MFLYDTPPCKKCRKRFMACHTVCDDYKNWKIEHENKRQKIMADNKTEMDIVFDKMRNFERYRRKNR